MQGLHGEQGVAGALDDDFEALMREWESEGHKLGTFKGVDGDSAESSSKVIKRMLEENGEATFLFKGPPEN